MEKIIPGLLDKIIFRFYGMKSSRTPSVVWFLPSDHQAQYYQSISNAAWHDDYGFMCEITDNRPSGSVGDPSLFDFTADVAKLETLLDELEQRDANRKGM